MSKEKATYIGKRIMANDSLAACFLHRGEKIFFKAVKLCQIGNDYEVSALKNTTRIERVPKDLGPSNASDETLEEWRAENAAAENLRRRKAEAKRFEKSETVKRAVEILKPLFRNLGHTTRNSLIDVIITEIDKEKWEKVNRDFNKRLRRAMKRGLKVGAGKPNNVEK